MGSGHFGDADLPATADVVVVGGGLAGLFAACFAHRAGLGRVVVLERRDAVASLTSAHSAEGFRLEWDAPENIAMVRDSVEVFEQFTELVGVPDIDIGLQRPGYLFLSGSAAPTYRPAMLAERVRRWHEQGLTDVEHLTGDEARRRFPFANDAVEQAHYRAADGFVDAAALARGLVLGGGFDTYAAAPAVAVEVDAGRVAGVRTASGRRVATRTVVLAGGPFTRRLAEAAGAPLPAESRRRHGLVLHLPPGQIDPSWPMVVDADLGLYWRPRPEGLFVGWEKALPWDQRPSDPLDPVPADLAYLEQVRTHGRRLTRFWPDLRFDAVTWHTGQYVAAAPNDGRPIIGPHPAVEGLYIDTAYEGRGIMASPAGGRLLARLIQGEAEPDASPFRVAVTGDRGNEPDRMVL
ncbi:MAG TPA: FAD-dependent oxidoreductase [Candidatus Dormibacteraeota bacterium]|nr:FAD-dependent oxidoreductase [Candidatus Dormibacteraeota bacterium]